MDDQVVDKKLVSLVANLINEVNGVPLKNIHFNDSLVTDLEMDSVEMIDLLMRLEDLGVAIPESDINSFLTVGDIVKYLQDIY